MKTQPSLPFSHAGYEIPFCQIIIILSALLFAPLMINAQPGSDKKIIICHHLPDNPDKTIILEIGLDELQEHLDHGDVLGPCDEGPVGEGNIIPYYIPPDGKIEEEIGAELTSLYEVFTELGSAPSDDIYMISGDQVLVEIIAEEGKISEILIKYGIEEYIDYREEDLILTVLFPIERLTELNDDVDDLISFVRPVYTPILKSGIVTSKGDISIRSDNARDAFEVNGDGVKVGVLSDSYDSRGFAAKDIANYDLPGDPYNPINPFEVEVLEDFPNNLGAHFKVVDEGRAILQITHDVAPGAKLVFNTGFISAEHMAEAIIRLQEAECDIIVDDITHIAEPYFQDGIISQAVDHVADLGVSYFSSAGNFGDIGFEGMFTPAQEDPSFHDFGIDGMYQKVSMEPGYYILAFQWDDVYKSLGGVGNLGALNDLDIFMVDDAGNTQVALNRNNLGGDPIEILAFKVYGEKAYSNIMIKRAHGTENISFKYIVFLGTEFNILRDLTRTSTVVGQPNAEGAFAVGAAWYINTPAFGVDPPTIASFSSVGGNLINGVNRYKPDFVGPNGVNTSVELGGQNTDNDMFPNFFGTSAAAPHAAAVAALLLESMSKFEVEFDLGAKMKETAIDMEQSGYDIKSGAGLIQADAAMMTFAAPKPTIKELIVPANVTPGAKKFNVTIIGKNLTENSRVIFNGATIQANKTTFHSTSEISASIPTFTGDPPLLVENPAITPSNLDGGLSNELHFFAETSHTIKVIADNQIKKFGERLPVFTSTILVDGVPYDELPEPKPSLEDLGLDGLDFKSSATSRSLIGIYYIHPFIEESAALENYEYEFKDGFLTIEKMPLTITPFEKDFIYGEKIEGIEFQYEFDQTYMDEIDIEWVEDLIELEHNSTFMNEENIAIVDRGRLFVNRGRLFVNGSGWLATDATLSNRGRLFVNGNIAYDIDIDLLEDYQDNPDGTITDRGRLLVNGQSLFNGTAEITDRGRLLVNEGGLVSSEDETDDFSDIIILVDTSDWIISSLYSINLISGLEVNEPEDPHYIIPGAFISTVSENFDISYGYADMNITPATLNVAVDDKLIFLGDPLPEYTCTYTGFKFEDNESTTFSTITYTPTEYIDVGTYEIMPTDFVFNEPVNYVLSPDPILPGTLTVCPLSNGRIVVTAENETGSYDLLMLNSNGTDPVTLASVSGSVQDPEFSPNGLEIAFTVHDGELANLWKVKSDGTELTQLTFDGISGLADFSPDGSKIVFIQDGDIAVVDPDGSNVEIVLETESNEWWPFYSHDGEEIYFTRYSGGGLNEIFKINLTTLDETQITFDNIFYRQPDFFRDGSRILSARADNAYSSSYDILTMDPDGNNQTSIYSGTLRSATASPDGTRIAFIRDNEGIGTLFVMDSDGTNVQDIYSPGPISVLQPDWGTYPESYVAIPDPKFEQALIDLGFDSDGIINHQIFKSDAKAVTFLNVSDPENNPELPHVNEKISDLTGIEAFVNLNYLNCTDNLLTNLDLSRNWALTEVYCSNNQLTTLDVSQCPALISIVCWNNLLANLDVTQNTLLTNLVCWNNQLTSLDVTQNTALTDFFCDNNHLTSLDVTQNTALTNMSCAFNQLTSLDVSQNTILDTLFCQDNQLTSLDVSANTVLAGLGCDRNQITELNMPQSNALLYLTCNANQLTSLDVSQNTAIQFLACAENQLSELNLTQNTALRQLSCWDNQLTELDITQSTALVDLVCYENNLSSLDVSQNAALISLVCHFNQLTALDVSNNTFLTNLHCPSNQITSLDVSNNTSLIDLVCAENQITSLSIAPNNALTILHCAGNLIPVLDVTQSTALTTIICEGNQLTSLDLSQNSLLNEIDCRFNNLVNLNVRNGNNSDFTSFRATNNFLSCITVDDETADHSGWLVDPGVIFSNDCGAETVYIQDNNFEGALIALGIDSDGIVNQQITYNDAFAVTSLNVENQGIANLTGIEGFVNLQYLNCSGNLLTHLDITQNTGLVELSCIDNDLTNLDVSQNTSLVYLACHRNQLTSLDVSQNTAMTDLSCYENQIPSLDVSQNTALVYLACPVNQLTELDISQNFALTYLNCDGNDISSLEVSHLTDLTTLSCGDNNLTTLDVSANIPLVNLDCHSNQLTDLIVTTNTGLIELICHSNLLSELDVSQNTLLNHLACDVNQLTSLDVSLNTSLVHLNCYDNQLTNLDVRNGNNANFTLFKADVNNLTCISVDDENADHSSWVVDPGVIFSNNCGEIVYIADPNFEQALIDLGYDSDITINQQISRSDAELIRNMNISNRNIHDLTGIDALINLQTLDCQNNLMTELDLSQNTALYQFTCRNNQLNTLNLPKVNGLITISCQENQLTSLDLSNNTALTTLYSQSNRLTELDLSGNPALYYLRCETNNLTALDISQNVDLQYFYCYDNQLTTLDARNGNNANFVYFEAQNNNLTCISVDDETADYSSWSVDPGVTFNNDCAFEEMMASAIGNGSPIVDGNVTLYPNPVVDWLTIEFTDESVVLSDVSINVYDGQANIYNPTILPGTTIYGFDVDFNSLSSDTYYVQLYDGIEVRVFRIMKE